MTENTFKELFSTAPAPLVVTDKEGNIRFINEHARMLLKAGENDLKGTALISLLDKSDETPGLSFSSFLEMTKNQREHVVRKKNGSTIYAEIDYSVNKTADGYLYTWSFHASEKNKRLAYDLKERVKEQLSILNTIETFFNYPDIDTALAHCLSAVRDGWQFPEATAVRIKLSDGKIYATENFSETKWMLDSPIKSVSEQLGVLEVCYISDIPVREGSVFLYEEMRLISILSKLLGLFIDQWRAMQLIKERDELTRKITSQSPGNTYVFEIEETGHALLIFVNKGTDAFNHSFEFEELKNQPEKLREVVHEEDKARFNDAMIAAYKSQAFLSVQYRICVNDVTRWRWLRAVPEKTSEGRVLWYGASQDITPLIEYITSMEQMLFDISHVIRRPVSNILGLTKLITDPDFSEKEIRDISGKLYQVANEMDKYIRELSNTYNEKKNENELFKFDFVQLIDKRNSTFS